MHDARGYWDRLAGQAQRQNRSDPWRSHMRRIYAGLAREWLAGAPDGPVLKTDVFEESICDDYPMADLRPPRIGVDIAEGALRSARAQLAASGVAAALTAADLRALPFATGSVAGVLSGSSLDHFQSHADIVRCLAELRRVLAPGGLLALALDNPDNPVVRLRNALPFGLLSRTGLVPYFVGATMNMAQAERALAEAGLEVFDRRFVQHAPRAPAIGALVALRRVGLGRAAAAVGRGLDAFEGLRRTPFARRSGYYVALAARKPGQRPLTLSAIPHV